MSNIFNPDLIAFQLALPHTLTRLYQREAVWLLSVLRYYGLRAGHLLIMCILIHSVVMMLSSVVLRGLDGGRVLYRSTRTVLSTVYLYSYIVWEHKSDATTTHMALYAQYI